MEDAKKECCGHGHGQQGGKCCRCKCAKNAVMAVLAIVLIAYLGVLIRNSVRTYDYIGKTPDSISQITVTGTAKVSATPDIALLNLGIISEGATVNAAQKGTTDKMNSIISALKDSFKIDAKDIQTENFSVSPKYDWSAGKQTIIGYTVSQSVAVKVRDFTKTGDILAKATELGANSVSGPNFSIDDPEKVKADAREKAIAIAKAKAAKLADQVGIKLGRIVNFYEGGSSEVANVAYGLDSRPSAVMMDKAIAPAVEPGSQDVQLTVSISYEIK